VLLTSKIVADHLYLRRRRCSPEAIRALVTQEAHEYYEKHGFPTGYFASSRGGPPSPSIRNTNVAYGGQPVSSYPAASLSSSSPSSPSVAGRSDDKGVEVSGAEGGGAGPAGPGLHFMDEPVYDWEINSNSDDEDDLEAEFDEKDYEDEDVEEENGGDEEEAVVDVKGKSKAKEDDAEEEEVKETSRGAKRSPRKKRKVDGEETSCVCSDTWLCIHGNGGGGREGYGSRLR
jgi:hypothetical protein